MTVFCAIADLSNAKTMESEPIFVLDVTGVRLISEKNPAAIVSDVLPLIDKSLLLLAPDFQG